mgnify:CR=1 FL=1
MLLGGDERGRTQRGNNNAYCQDNATTWLDWTRAEAEHHPDSNIITRAVGFNAKPYADFWMLPARTGLRLLICSDGLTKEVTDDRIRLHLAAGLTPVETAGALLDAALAAGGRDNVTAIVVDVLDAPEIADIEDTAPRSRSN